MDNGLAIRGDMIRSYGDLMQVAEMLTKSGLLPQSIKTKEQAAVIILKGRELGFPTLEAFAQINVIQGKPTISPQGMISLVRRTGQLEYLKIEQNDNNTATTVRVKRKGEPEHATTFSDEDAKAMGLLGKDNWQKQKPVMRQWRAVGANLRITFADIIGGMYPPEEMGADVNDEGEILQETKTVENMISHEVAEAVAEHAYAEGLRDGYVESPAPATVTLPADPFQQPNAQGVVLPRALAITLKQYAAKPFSSDEKKEKARGAVVGTLDDFAGDPQRRLTFLKAVFGIETSKDLRDGQIWALWAWKDAPNAKSEVNRVIADYLKAQGQGELFAEPQPVAA